MSAKKGGEGGSRFGGFSWKKVGIASLAVNLVLGLSLFLSGASDGSEAKEVNQLIDKYFRVWSVQDMDAYRDCFHPSAVIYFVDGNGVPQPSGLGPFVESQREAHQASRVIMREIPLEVRTEVDGNIARSLVRWKLFSERGEEVGTDYFTMIKSKSGWRIISLLFRKDG